MSDDKSKRGQPDRSVSTSSQVYGRKFKGLLNRDFSIDVTGTHWRCRQQLGHAVANGIDNVGFSFKFESWAIYNRPQIHWADKRYYVAREGSSNRQGDQYPKKFYQAKFLADIDEKSLWYGFYLERSEEMGERREDWKRFLDWLKTQSGEMLLMDLSKEYGLEVSWGGVDWQEVRGEKRIPRNFDNLHHSLSQLPDGQWVNLLIGCEISKKEALNKGASIANGIAKLLTAMVPLYDGAVTSHKS